MKTAMRGSSWTEAMGALRTISSYFDEPMAAAGKIAARTVISLSGFPLVHYVRQDLARCPSAETPQPLWPCWPAQRLHRFYEAKLDG